MKSDTYIGEKKIRSVDQIEETTKVKVTFKDNSEVELEQKLFNLIVKTEKGNGTVHECTKTYISMEFLLKMGEYGIQLGDLEGLGQAIAALSHNAKERKIGEMFGVETTHEIPVSAILS